MKHSALLLILAATACAPGLAQRLRVTETAGIRRFNYPVTAKLWPNLPAGPLRLEEEGKPVASQFQGEEIDFNVSLGPYEQREFTVRTEMPHSPFRLDQAIVREEGENFLVGYTPNLQFAVPRNLLGFLSSVKTSRWDYLRPGSQGLLLRYRDDILYRVGGWGPHGAPTRARLVKQGPLSSVLEFSSTEGLRGSRSVPSLVRFEFPRSKSWAKTTWTVEDPEGFLSGLGLELNLNIEGEPALVDFGGSSMVYGQLRSGQAAALIGGPQSWRVLLGPTAALEPYVAAERGLAEGWAHLMDRQRCTAVAVEDFGRRQDRIEADAQGRLQIWREFRGAGPKSLTFWLHFVSMPVQVGAATSPQSMLAPLKVEWLPWNPKN